MVLGLHYYSRGTTQDLRRYVRYRVFGAVLRATLLRFAVRKSIDAMNYSLLFFIMTVKRDIYDFGLIYYAHLTASPIPTTHYEDDKLKMGANPVLHISTHTLEIRDIGLNREIVSRITGPPENPLEQTYTVAKDQKTGTSPLALITPSSFTI